ncbi:MAG: Gx transporter family protein [Corallococcus sp.]|nr:Gx transporter family protein [Corallococcus sp.]MCM1358992.1 Gx transporter family protein [Corallococcus sp.]MCM1394981.1 Gx transporter family protein [Corallococcus sp.]
MSQIRVKTQYFSARRLAYLSVLTAMGLIMFMVESLFPPLFLPGAKMGLSNIFSMLALFTLGPVDALILVIIRTTLGSVFMGNISTLLYSMSAGVVSVVVSAFLVQFVYPHVSIVAISVVSAVMHNLTQNVVFCLVSNTPQMFSYMPWLGLLGIVAGLIVGFAVWLILRGVPVRIFASVLGVSAQDLAPVSATESSAENNTETTGNGGETDVLRDENVSAVQTNGTEETSVTMENTAPDGQEEE